MLEWKILQSTKWEDENKRIDILWKYVSTKNDEELRYPTLDKIIKSILTVCHGNADVERDFSLSGRLTTTERESTSLQTLNSKITILPGFHYSEINIKRANGALKVFVS